MSPMTAEELREALDSFSPWHDMGADEYEVIEDAARTIALPILEQDSAFRTRVWLAICSVFDDDTDCDEITDAVLAALVLVDV